MRSAKCVLQSYIKNNQLETKEGYWIIKSYLLYTDSDGKVTRRILASNGDILDEQYINVVQAAHEFIKSKQLSSRHLANRDTCCSIFAILDTNHVLNLCFKLLDDIQSSSYTDSACIFIENLERSI